MAGKTERERRFEFFQICFGKRNLEAASSVSGGFVKASPMKFVPANLATRTRFVKINRRNFYRLRQTA